MADVSPVHGPPAPPPHLFDWHDMPVDVHWIEYDIQTGRLSRHYGEALELGEYGRYLNNLITELRLAISDARSVTITTSGLKAIGSLYFIMHDEREYEIML